MNLLNIEAEERGVTRGGLCNAPNPSDPDVLCDLREGHDMPLHIKSQLAAPSITWEPEPDISPVNIDLNSRMTPSTRTPIEVPGGGKALRRAIMRVVGEEWMNCREIIEEIFGYGPYTYEEAVSLNKVHTEAKTLWERGQLERVETSPLMYRLPASVQAA